jgi:glycosyltransferase involved in cell wall biosynthesis
MRKIEFINSKDVLKTIGGVESVTIALCSILGKKYEVSCSMIRDFSTRLRQRKLRPGSVFINQNPFETSLKVVVRARLEKLKIFYCIHSEPLFLVRHSQFTSKGLWGKIKAGRLFVYSVLWLNLLLVFGRGVVVLHETHLTIIRRLTPSWLGNKCFVIPNPVIMPVQKKQLNSARNSVIILGRLVGLKRVDLALDIWSELSSLCFLNQLQVIGSGPLENALKTKMIEEEIPNVTFIGEVSDPTNYLNSAKYLLVTSYYEGLPMVVLEALAHGVTPIIIDSFLSARYLTGNGTLGILLKERAPKEMATELLAATESFQPCLRSRDSLLKLHGAAAIERHWERLIENC